VDRCRYFLADRSPSSRWPQPGVAHDPQPAGWTSQVNPALSCLGPKAVAAQDSPSCARHPAGMSVLGRPRAFSRRRHRPDDEDPLIFAGSASPRLTAAICRELGVGVGSSEVIRFSEGTLFVRVLENVRGRSVYLVQSTVFPTNANFMELLFWIDAFSRASADSVTVVVPYFSYAKGDKKDEPRVSIRARVCADAIEAAGADRVVTLDLHAPQIQGFFRVPVDDLYAMPYLCAEIERVSLGDPVVVSPDAGFAKGRGDSHIGSARPSRSLTRSAKVTVRPPRLWRSWARWPIATPSSSTTSRSVPARWSRRPTSS
jgi:N-terminal domain of ribose phosphate pyrophosphokinase